MEEGEAEVSDLPRSLVGRPAVYCPFCGRLGEYRKQRTADNYTEHFSHRGHEECVETDLARILHAQAIREITRRLAAARATGTGVADTSCCRRCRESVPRPLLHAGSWDAEHIERRVDTSDGYRIPDIVIVSGTQHVAFVEVALTCFVDGQRLQALVAAGVPGVEYDALKILSTASDARLPVPLQDWNRTPNDARVPLCDACRRPPPFVRPLARLLGRSPDVAAIRRRLGDLMGFGDPSAARPEHLILAFEDPGGLRDVDSGAATRAIERPLPEASGLRDLVRQALGWRSWGIWHGVSLVELLADPFERVRQALVSKGWGSDSASEDDLEKWLSAAGQISDWTDKNPDAGIRSCRVLAEVYRAARRGCTVVSAAELTAAVSTSDRGVDDGSTVTSINLLVAKGALEAAGERGPEWVGVPALLAAERETARRLSGSLPDRRLPRRPRRDEPASSLNKDQRRACIMAGMTPLAIVTGGPGTGKTHVLREIITEVGGKWLALAPTWKAVGRLRESLTSSPVVPTFDTVAGFIGATVGTLPNGERNSNPNPSLASGWNVVVDEAGCIDAPAFADLLKGCSPATRLLLVGDPEQLPSVGPGAVLRDLTASRVLPHVQLTEVVRAKSDSGIPDLARSMLAGAPRFAGRAELRVRDDREIVKEVVHAYRTARFKRVPANEIQVISPLNRVVNELNGRLQDAVNARGRRVGLGFRIGDPVIAAEHFGDVTKGELGILVDGTDTGEAMFEVAGRRTPLSDARLRWLELAYCLTVHKAQGSEWNWVIVALPSCRRDDFIDRALVYTAVTRARKGVVVFSRLDVLTKAVSIERSNARQTLLGTLLSARSATREQASRDSGWQSKLPEPWEKLGG